MSAQHSLVLVTKDDIYGNLHNAVHVVLSPYYYWIQEASLNVKYPFQALSYASSIFEDCLPVGNYKYQVVKKDDKFLFIAYDLDDILAKLEGLGIKKEQVLSIDFLQNINFQASKAISLNNTKSLVNLNGLMQEVNTPVQNATKVDRFLNQIQPSRHKLKLNSNNIYTTLNIALVLILSILSFQYVSSKLVLSNLENEKENIKTKYKLPQTSFEFNSIYKELQKQDKQQLFIREKIKNRSNVKYLEVNTKKVVVK